MNTGIPFDDTAQCPTWLKFLDRIFQRPDGSPDKELIEFVHRAVGYSTTGDTSARCLFLMHGAGATGKTTFMNAILGILGEYAMQIDLSAFQEYEHEQDRQRACPDLARLSRARFVAIHAPKQGFRLDESTVKLFTGEEEITCRFLFRDKFSYMPTFKVWLSANRKPEIHSTDAGILRRIVTIPFNSVIAPEELDPDLSRKLKDEYPGILKWAVMGATQWHKNGLAPPASVQP